MINSKNQVIFVHVIVNIIFKYRLQVYIYITNFCVIGHIKVNYGCYELAKNDNLHIHTLSWFNEFPNPNTLI
jgi:hypothetical protein